MSSKIIDGAWREIDMTVWRGIIAESKDDADFLRRMRDAEKSGALYHKAANDDPK